MDGQCLKCLVNEFEERFQSEPAQFRDNACVICLSPLLTPVVVVERETWETLFHAGTFDELGRDFKISNASFKISNAFAKLVKMVGFPLDLLSSLMRDVAMTTREGKSVATFWDRKFHFVHLCDRGSCEMDAGCRVRGWVSHSWRAMDLLAGMNLTQQSGADVAYGNIRKKNNTLKCIVSPGTVTETTRQQPNGVVTSELTFKFSIAKVIVTIDPPNTCRTELSAADPLLTGPEGAELSRCPHLPPWDCSRREYAQLKFMQFIKDEPEISNNML
jgi:hypothetical protein